MELTVEQLFEYENRRHADDDGPYREITVKPKNCERYSDDYETRFLSATRSIPLDTKFSIYKLCKNNHMDRVAYVRHLKPWLKEQGLAMERVGKFYLIKKKEGD